jgi:hypothetical protein
VVENTAISKDGHVVTLRLERRYSKSVGADFVTGGLHDYRSTTEEGFYLTVRGGPSKDAKKLIECIRSSIKSLTGNFPSVMPPTKASGVIEFVFDSGLSEAEIMNSIVSAISVTELGLTRIWTGLSAQDLPAPRRHREKMAATSFTQGEFTTLLDEIEEDYGDVVKRITGKGFLRNDTSLASHWSTRYDGPDILKEMTVDFTITGNRTRRRIEEQVEVQPGFLGRLFGKKPVPGTVVRYEETNEIKSIDVLLVSNFTVLTFFKKDVGRDFVTGGTVDYAARVGDMEGLDNRNVIMNEVITPHTLDLLDSTVRKALLAFQERANVTFEAS